MKNQSSLLYRRMQYKSLFHFGPTLTYQINASLCRQTWCHQLSGDFLMDCAVLNRISFLWEWNKDWSVREQRISCKKTLLIATRLMKLVPIPTPHLTICRSKFSLTSCGEFLILCSAILLQLESHAELQFHPFPSPLPSPPCDRAKNAWCCECQSSNWNLNYFPSCLVSVCKCLCQLVAVSLLFRNWSLLCLCFLCL